METAINAAIASYCRDHGYERALKAFVTEAALLDFRNDENTPTLEQKFYMTAKLQTSLHVLERERESLKQQLDAFYALTYGEEEPGEWANDLAFSQYCSTTDSEAVVFFEVSTTLPLYVISTIDHSVSCKKFTGQVIWHLPPSSIPVTCLAISPNGCSLAIGFDDGHVDYFQNLVSRSCEPTMKFNLGENKRCKTLRLSDARLIALTTDGEFIVCSTVDGSILRSIVSAFTMSSWDLDIEAGLVIAGTEDGKLLSWDWTSGAENCLLSQDRKIDYVKVIGSRMIATAQRDGQPKIWRLGSQEDSPAEFVTSLIYHSNWVIGIAKISHEIITMSDDGRIASWNLKTLKQIGEARIAPCAKFKISNQASWLLSLTSNKLQLYQQPRNTRAPTTRSAARKILTDLNSAGENIVCQNSIVSPRCVRMKLGADQASSPEGTELSRVEGPGSEWTRKRESEVNGQKSELIAKAQGASGVPLQSGVQGTPLTAPLSSPRDPHEDAQLKDAQLKEASSRVAQATSAVVSVPAAHLMSARHLRVKSDVGDRLSKMSTSTKISASVTTSSEETIIVAKQTRAKSPLRAEKTSTPKIKSGEISRKSTPGDISRKTNTSVPKGEEISGGEMSSVMKSRDSFPQSALPPSSLPSGPNSMLTSSSSSIRRPVTARNLNATRSTPTAQKNPPAQRMNIAQRLELEVKAAQALLVNDGKPKIKSLRSSGGGIGQLESGRFTDRAKHSIENSQKNQIVKKEQENLLNVDPTISRLLQQTSRTRK